MNDVFKEIIDFIRKLYNKQEGQIPLHAPVFNGNEKKYLNECIDTTFVSSVGAFVDKFETEIAKFTGVKKAVSCVNGTNALHLALSLVGVENNTEVITQPLTFIATANAIRYCGADPVFLDVDLDTMGLSPTSLRTWLKNHAVIKTGYSLNKTTGRRISACIPMHTFGHPCRVDEIVNICNEFNIPVVEDAAESLGSFYKGKHTGTFGKIGVLSFNGNKIITTGGGGMLLFDNVDLAIKAKHLTTQAKIPHPWEFNHDAIGYNYRMPNINAALGLAQLEQLPILLSSKRNLANRYKEFFSTIGIRFFEEPTNSKSNYWLNAIFFSNRNERDQFLEISNSLGVNTRPSWNLIPSLQMFSSCFSDDNTNAKNISDKLVNIPSSPIL